MYICCVRVPSGGEREGMAGQRVFSLFVLQWLLVKLVQGLQVGGHTGGGVGCGSVRMRCDCVLPLWLACIHEVLPGCLSHGL